MLTNVTSEKQRKLQDLTWVSGLSIQRDLPKDCVLKRLQYRINGSVVTTFSSTPVAFEVSSFDNLVSRIDVTVEGNRLVKSVRPWLLHMEQLLITNTLAERKSSAAASTILDNNALADAGFTYGSTTNTTTVTESVILSFECPWALPGMGREMTWLDLRGASSAETKLQCGTTANLDKTTNCTFSAAAFTIEVVTIEAQDLPKNVVFSDYKQTTKEVTFAAQATASAIDINRGNSLIGLKLFCIEDSAAASGTTALRKQPTNFGITDLVLQLNGNRIIKATNFRNLQTENRMRFGVNAAYSSSASKLDGFAYMDLLDRRDLRTALKVQPPDVDNVQLLVSTHASDATLALYGLSLTVETGELVRYR